MHKKDAQPSFPVILSTKFQQNISPYDINPIPIKLQLESQTNNLLTFSQKINFVDFGYYNCPDGKSEDFYLSLFEEKSNDQDPFHFQMIKLPLCKVHSEDCYIFTEAVEINCSISDVNENENNCGNNQLTTKFSCNFTNLPEMTFYEIHLFTSNDRNYHNSKKFIDDGFFNTTEISSNILQFDFDIYKEVDGVYYDEFYLGISFSVNNQQQKLLLQENFQNLKYSDTIFSEKLSATNESNDCPDQNLSSVHDFRIQKFNYQFQEECIRAENNFTVVDFNSDESILALEIEIVVPNKSEIKNTNQKQFIIDSISLSNSESGNFQKQLKIEPHSIEASTSSTSSTSSTLGQTLVRFHINFYARDLCISNNIARYNFDATYLFIKIRSNYEDLVGLGFFINK